MIFEWDSNKNRVNIAKHSLSFEQAKEIFSSRTTLFIADEVVDGEERWKAIGTIADHRYILVVHTYYEDDGTEVIRIISARKLKASEVTKWL